MQQITYVNKLLEKQKKDQYKCSDILKRVFATLEYYTYRSINKTGPCIFAEYNGKNNSWRTKTLEELKSQLKTGVLSFLESHQDMINIFIYFFLVNNFTFIIKP